MNSYYNAMEHCVPPEGLRERMKEKVLAGQHEKGRAFKPKGFRKKTAVMLLAAVLLLGTSATTIWDPLFVRRFGPQAALSALGGAVFQEVNVTSVCDDVSLTVTQALCSDKTIHYILEYRLPEGAPQEGYDFPEFYYYGTRDYTWEQLRELCQEDWGKQDWTDWTAFGPNYLRCEDNPLWASRLRLDGSSGSFSGEAKDGMLRFYFKVNFGEGVDLTAQPLTILVTPPCTRAEDGTQTAVTNHPAIITFQPAYDGPQARTAALEEGNVSIRATLSPFSLALEAGGMGYPYYEDMVKDTRLITKDGQEKPVSLLGFTGGGGGVGSVDTGEMLEVSTTVNFILITDISDFAAIRMGDYELPLS